MSRAPLPAGFGALWSTVAIDLVGFGIVIPILPLYADRFDASPAVIGLLLASFSLAQLVAAPAWGRLSDRIGRKPVLVVSLVGTAVGSLLTALAPNILLLFAGRLVDGASGGSVAVAQAAAADLAPADQRPRLLGLLGAAYGIGFVAGPALGGAASLVGDRAPFFLAAALAGANAVVAVRRLQGTTPPRPSTMVSSATASEGRQAGGLVPLLVVGFLTTAAFSGFETTFALLGAQRLDLSAASISLFFVAAGVVIAATNTRAVAPAVHRLGELGALRMGLVVDAAGLALLALTDSLPSLALAVALLAAGHGLAAPALAAAVTARVAPERRGGALGSQQAAASLARIAGPVLAGALFAAGGPGTAFVAAAALAVMAAAATQTPGRRVTLAAART